MDKDKTLELANERVENARKTVAKCLNMLELAVQDLKWACEDQGWNEEVAYQLEDATTKLGYALATLTRWNDAVEEE